MAPDLTDSYRLYISDMPGEGRSGKPSYRGRDHRSFLVAYPVGSLNAIGLSRPHVVGLPFGGGQAFLQATITAELIASASPGPRWDYRAISP